MVSFVFSQRIQWYQNLIFQKKVGQQRSSLGRQNSLPFFHIHESGKVKKTSAHHIPYKKTTDFNGRGNLEKYFIYFNCQQLA